MSTAREKTDVKTQDYPGRPRYVVGVGASAGGLEALESMFLQVPVNTGMAFVIVQHLSPDFRSLMDELLARWTSMAIHRVEHEMRVEANAVYLIPPRKDMVISRGRLLLSDKKPDHGLSLPIDHFLKSLAQDRGQTAIAVILSGTGSDGSRGIEDIKQAGGLVIAQTADSSKFDGMPNAARESGCVDVSLPPEEIGEALVEYHSSGCDIQRLTELEQARPLNEDGLTQMFRLLRDRFAIDFSYYKLNTIVRRTERRLQLAHVETVQDYAELLVNDPDELDALYHDLLVGVTRFFRDADAWRVLEGYIDQIIESREADSEIRAWVAGCATGEEAYSISILLHERVRASGKPLAVRVFATDVHRRSLEIAGEAAYPPEAVADVSESRLQEYFSKNPDGFVLESSVRQSVVFAAHNIVKDAPFTRLDLITCRNLLIYLQPPAQKKAISLFHFGLRTNGLLFLGPSESPGELDHEFQTLDVHWKIYRKVRDIRLPIEVRLPMTPGHRPVRASGLPEISTSGSRAAETALLGTYDTLLAEYMPPALLINSRHELLQVFGEAGKFLRHAAGRTSRDVLDLLDSPLKLAINGALQQINHKRKSVMQLRGIVAQTTTGSERVAVTVRLVQNQRTNSMDVLILLESMETVATVDGRGPAAERSNYHNSTQNPEVDGSQHNGLISSSEQIQSLESDLQFARENLQATVEELETSNEELQTTNEELVASNEELQSTNEELQSVNEELYTVNAEHQRKIQELTILTDDMDNLLASTRVHTVFLDHELRIRKFTPQIAEVFNFTGSDTGRTLDSFSHRLHREQLTAELAEVLETGKPIEADVQHVNGRWYLMRLLPYVTRGTMTGVLLTLIDITSLKRAQQDLARREFELRMVANHVPSLISYVDASLRYQYVNKCYCDFFGRAASDIIGLQMSELHDAGTFADLKPMIRLALNGKSVEFEKRFDRADGPGFWAIVSYTPDIDENRQVRGFFVCKHLVTALKESEQRFNRAVHGTTDGIFDWNLRTGKVYFSPRYLQLLGFDNDTADLVKTDVDQRIHPDDIGMVQTAEQSLVRDGVPYDVEYRLKCNNGEYHWFRGRAALQIDSLGRPAYVSGSLQDVNDYKALVEEKEYQVVQRDRFLAMLSHELRNPLGAVVNGCHALSRIDLAEPQRPVVAAILRQSLQMAALLEDLLDVARITEGKIELEMRQFDLRDILPPALESVQPLIESRQQQIECRVPDGPVYVDGNSVRLQQVASNLLSNASKYSPLGSGIRIVLETAASWASLRIIDQGDGIPPELLQRVFEPFEQLGRKLDRTDGGMGLGLTLARRLVELHGGEIGAHSDGAGQGSEFTVRIPLSRGPGLRKSEVEPAGKRPTHLKVTIIEDNADARRLLQMLLNQLDFNVTVAGNGVEGLAQLRAFLPDVAIVDIGLPEMDGYAVAAAVREDSALRSIYLIALTGYGQASDRRKALEAGFNTHLTKPLNLQELEALLQEQAQRGRSGGRDDSEDPRQPSNG